MCKFKIYESESQSQCVNLERIGILTLFMNDYQFWGEIMGLEPVVLSSGSLLPLNYPCDLATYHVKLSISVSSSVKWVKERLAHGILVKIQMR